jgi:SAM-dependent methyltransferase
MRTTHPSTGGPYGENYASQYNNIWGNSEKWGAEAKFHIETISSFIKADTRWLDAGCGTGYFLSHFPDVYRAGFDLSPFMLSEARKANPNAQFFQEMNLLDNKPEWENSWNLVTCTGQPWSYFKTLEEIEQTVENLSKFTSKDGVCILTPIDISDFIGYHVPVFFNEKDIPNEVPVITAVNWIYKELEDVEHQCLYPNLDQWVRWFSKYFYKIEIIQWPHEPAFLVIPRRVIVCSEKREIGDEREAVVIEHSVANVSKDEDDEEETTSLSPSSLSSKQLISELAKRIGSGSIFKAMVRKLFL